MDKNREKATDISDLVTIIAEYDQKSKDVFLSNLYFFFLNITC